MDVFLNPSEVQKIAELHRRLAALESRNTRSPQRAVARQGADSAWVTSTDYSTVIVVSTSIYVPTDALVKISFGCRFRTYSAGATGDAVLELQETTEGIDMGGVNDYNIAKGYYGNPDEAGLRFVHINASEPRGGAVMLPAAIRQNEGTRTFRVILKRDAPDLPNAEISKAWLAVEAQ